MNNKIQNLMAFLDASPSVYHAVDNLANLLENSGYTRLSEADNWDLIPGGKYYLIRGGSALMAFRIPNCTPTGFMMTAGHSDRPTFKIKENGELAGAYIRLAVERYGMMMIAPWLDRPLSVAGRVLVETENGIESKLLNIDRNLMMIPNAAIHLNRQANDGYKWNPAVDVLPLLGGKDAKGKFAAALEEAAGGKILGSDLYLYIREKACIWGIDDEYISSAALDDLECVWGCTQGFLNAAESEAIPVLCVFNNEEVGSSSSEGADSNLLSGLLERICSSLGLDLYRMLARSFMVSADNAHALHPNHPELADPTNAPVPGGGIVLKFNASQRYCTDGVSAAILRKVCAKAGVSVQTYCNRADLPGGSTLGNISLHHVSIPTADIGLAQFAMHSSYETAAVSDAAALADAMAVFYGSSLEPSGSGYLLK